jgi:DNA-binding MarR family transcriptional regulator
MPARQSRSAAGAVHPDQAAPLQEVTLRLVRRLRKQSASGLTLSQTSALSTLERNGPMRVGELARREQIGKSSVTRLVARLEAMDYLTREVDPDDGRSSLVRISTPGHALLRQARKRGNEYLADELGRLDATDRAALLDALPALERLVALRRQAPGQ